jgi:4'-phosphopantetheinyl transferase
MILPDDEVHVWLIPLTTTVTPCLSERESARAARFVFEKDRKSYTVGHTALRDILGRYAGERPDTLAFLAAHRGKPYLRDHPEIRFNLSDSGEFALVGVARGREVGIDIERIRGERPTENIAHRFFGPGEVRELMDTPEEARVHAFFNCWTRKEAYIKARGEGLHMSLSSFEVSLGNEALIRKAEDRERWSIRALEAPAGYKAAVIVEGSGWDVKRLDWTQL